jgi:hypothetical protein
MSSARTCPPLAADERTTLETFLDKCRTGVRTGCEGVSEADAQRTVLPAPTTSLAGLVSHLRWVEAAWFEVALLGEKNRASEFKYDLPFGALLDEYDAQCERSRRIVKTLSLDTAVADGGELYSVRWILFHMLEETAKCLGQIAVTRTLLDARAGRLAAAGPHPQPHPIT